MFVLASLMALAAAGAALELTGSRGDDDGDLDSLPPTLGDLDPGEVGNVGSGDPVVGFPDEPDAGGATPADPDEPMPDPDEPIMPDGQRIEGSAGADDLAGSAGDDSIHGGDGADWVQGDGGDGDSGSDQIDGGMGDDSLAGQGGDDLIWGQDGDDTILGGDGNDTLFGGEGNDWLSGHDGDDVLVSGGGADDLDGGRGNDLLVGAADPETVWLHGGEGDDTLMPGAGDFAEGQRGADSFVLQQAPGALPVIADFDAHEDQMVLHLPADLAERARIELADDHDGTVLITVNGEAIGRMLQSGGLTAERIVIVRLPV